MSFRLAPVAGAALLVSACASEPPFVVTNYRAHQIGYVEVCYSPDNATPQKIWQLADDACKRYQRTAVLKLQQTGQCSWTAPTLAYFTCEIAPGDTLPALVQKNSPMRRYDSSNYGLSPIP